MTIPCSTTSSLDHVITILVVDDHRLVRESVRMLLSQQNDFSVVDTAESADEAISKIATLQPDLVLMDIEMPDMNCLEAIAAIRSVSPQTKVMLVGGYANDRYLEQAVQTKADGFLSKSDGVEVLVRGIREVSSGENCYSVDSTKLRSDHQGRVSPHPRSGAASLSQRERELLCLLAKGMSLKEAAGIQGISYKTADKQKASLMAKLNIHDRVELARYAIREGLVQP